MAPLRQSGSLVATHPRRDNGDGWGLCSGSLQGQWSRGCCCKGADYGIRVLILWFLLTRRCREVYCNVVGFLTITAMTCISHECLINTKLTICTYWTRTMLMTCTCTRKLMKKLLNKTVYSGIPHAVSVTCNFYNYCMSEAICTTTPCPS